MTIVGTLVSCGNNKNTDQYHNTEKSNKQVKIYEQFKVDYSLNGNLLDVAILTDLPDDIEVLLTVSRSYWEKGNSSEFSVGYLYEKSTVGKLKSTQTISLDNNKWQADLATKQKDMAVSGLGFDVDKISDSIKIYAVVPFSNNPFPDFKEKGMGQYEIMFYLPINAKVETKSKYGNFQSLEKGRTYSVSKSTPLMPELNPSNPIEAKNKIKELPLESRITILSVKTKNNIPWYEVKAYDRNDNIVGTGWINSTALIGQELKVIK
ncbi:MAG: hypothetical protein KIT33_12110 [Candidatus Kapabacteria bacterium]|nr:hypothetical protein [Ignavibacteriota bacterium]MCW5885704.1 hypothetical protein [Candidatus Kapabacteria bacterium]